MHHIFFIDPIEKLNTKKDSSLQMALTGKKLGKNISLLFEKDFYFVNHESLEFTCYDFSGDFKAGSFYLDEFKVTNAKKVKLNKETIIHFRLDPPFDTRYQRILWMLASIYKSGVKIVNHPQGILLNNEKLFAYEQKSALPSFVGSSLTGFKEFISKHKSEAYILKPLDQFQGIGVEKVMSTDSLLAEKFLKKVQENLGAVVVQPYASKVESGEIRALYYQGEELGSILKVPKKGEFLANIAQGASYKAIKLEQAMANECRSICRELLKSGVSLVAFDILGDHVNEVNITCPGLLVEVSEAHGKNLAEPIIGNYSCY